jgi:flagellar basal-body rod modification protein FlgD
MTTVSSAGATATSTASQATKAASTGIAGDLQSFMKLLVTQLQHQDPSAPVDSTQFVTQLAMFAQAEQAVSANTKLDTIVGMVQGQILSTASSFLGRTVVVPSDGAAFDGTTPVRFSYTVPSDTSSVTVKVLDGSGRVVRTVTGTAAAGTYDDGWDGKTDAGGTAPAGNYTLEVTAVAADGTPKALETTVAGKVEELRVADGAVVAVVAGKEIGLDKITSVAPAAGASS